VRNASGSAPSDFSEYWVWVAWGESGDHETHGARAVIR